MDDNFSTGAINAIKYSQEEAMRLGYVFIGTEHITLGILRQGNRTLLSILEDNGIDIERLRRSFEIWAVRSAYRGMWGRYNLSSTSRLPVQ